MGSGAVNVTAGVVPLGMGGLRPPSAVTGDQPVPGPGRVSFLGLTNIKAFARRWKRNCGMAAHFRPAPVKEAFAILVPKFRAAGRPTGKQLWTRLRFAVRLGLATRGALEDALRLKKAARDAEEALSKHKVVDHVATQEQLEHIPLFKQVCTPTCLGIDRDQSRRVLAMGLPPLH